MIVSVILPALMGLGPFFEFSLAYVKNQVPTLTQLCCLMYQAHQDLPDNISWIPRMEHTVFGLIKKRGEGAGQHQLVLKAADTLKADLDAIDRGLVLCAYEDDPKGIAPCVK